MQNELALARGRKRNSTKRISAAVIKRRIRTYMNDNQPCNKSQIVRNVQGNSLRLQHMINRMLVSGDLKATTKGLVLSSAKKAPPALKEPEPEHSGGAMSESNLGKLIIVGAVGAAGVWLVIVLLAFTLIQTIGG
jgi:hypothetical protein